MKKYTFLVENSRIILTVTAPTREAARAAAYAALLAKSGRKTQILNPIKASI